jgi:hypothetical protein
MKKRNKLKQAFSAMLLISTLTLLAISCKGPEQTEEWIPLFNGQNLDGWDIKIRGYELNDNYGNTFRVEDGVLKACYDEYEEFGNRFGHIFYNQEFSHYKLRVEYRFVGEQAKGGPGWAFRNNGIMFHSQPVHTMEFDQSFPVSLEAQMLGGDGFTERPNGSVCTPGTNVEVNGVRIYDHCISSNAKTFRGDEWVLFELVVYGDSLAHHIISGDTVMTYTNFRLEDSDQPLGKGFIALQAESHPTEFRSIELLNLRP